MSERVLYVDGSLAQLHLPSGDGERRPGVLIVPPFGWDEIASHRALRDCAEELARHGHAVLRLDLPGTGDSDGGPFDDGLLDRWRAAVANAADALRAEAEVGTVVGVGVGLGGLLAYEAAAHGALDHLALWAVPAKGRSVVRELAAFASLETARILESGSPEGPPLPEGLLAPSGFVLAPETVAALGAIDLRRHRLRPGTRVLVLDRDGVRPDAALLATIAEAGAELTVASGKGYAEMLAEPDQARTPVESLETLRAWLAEIDEAPAEALRAPACTGELQLEGLRERPFEVATPAGRLVGIVSLPDEEARPLTALFLNAGAVRRIGPHRLWVDTARRWAARGVPVARLDLAGIGDSDGEAARLRDVATFYDSRYTDQVSAALDALQSAGLGPRFLVAGLCSGSSWAFQGALHDPRIVAALMVNPRILFWDERIDALRDLRRTRLLVKPVTWKRLLRGDVSWQRYRSFGAWATSTIVGSLSRRAEGSPVLDQVVDAFDRLREREVDLRFVFCEGEPLHDELRHDGLLSQERWPNVSVVAIPGRDHTLRPLWMHEHVDAALDEALERRLAAARPEGQRAA